MPSIVYKSLDRLIPKDVLLVDAGALVRSGKEIEDRTIKELAKHKVAYVPIISLSYEDKHKKVISGNNMDLENTIQEIIQENEETRFIELKKRLKEKINSIYVPFDESESIFHARGKKKQITKDKLLERDPGPLYRDDITAGSQSILKPNDLAFIIEIVKQLFKGIEPLTYLGPETQSKKNTIKRLHLDSIRLHSFYDNDRLRIFGDATSWQAVDIALYLMYAITNLNKKRITQGCPVADARFDPDKPVHIDTEVQYQYGRILDAIIGILFHNIGFSHKSIHSILSAKPILDRDNHLDKQKIRVLQRNLYVCSHIMDRQDISSISNMMCTMRYRYPDGTGFPPLNENRFLHEFVRLFQIIEFYDEMTHPVLAKVPFSRMDVINYMKEHSGEYKYNYGKFIPQAKFDTKLFDEFLQILKPWEINEKIYLYKGKKRNDHILVGRVYSYLDSYIPLISILRDEKRNKNYTFGELLFYIPKSLAFFQKKGKIVKKIQYDWIKQLEIFDKSINAANISEYEDLLYGEKRVLSRRLRKLA